MSEVANLSVVVSARGVNQTRAGLMSVERSALGASRAAVKSAAAFAGLASAAVGLKKMVDVTVGFDKSMRNVNSIAGLSEKKFQTLRKEVLKLAGPTAQAPKTLADGLYDLESSGFKAHQAIKILRVSAVAATAGLTDTATATKAVAAVLNAYHRPAKDAKQISDDLFQTVNRGVITFGELATTIGTVLPFANSLHVGLKQVGASISTMTKQGIEAANATTYLKNLMVQFLKPSDAMAAAIKKTGAESGEALVKQKGFQGALEAVIKTTDGSKRAIAALVPDIRAQAAAFALTGSNAKSAHADIKAFAHDSGISASVFKEQSKSAAVQWDKFKAVVSVLAIQVGSRLLPVMVSAAKAASRFVQQMSDGTGAGGRFVNKLRAIADAVGPIVHFFAQHPRLIAIAVGAWVTYRIAAKAALVATRLQLIGSFIGLGPKAAAGGAVAGRAFGMAFARVAGPLAAAAIAYDALANPDTAGLDPGTEGRYLSSGRKKLEAARRREGLDPITGLPNRSPAHAPSGRTIRSVSGGPAYLFPDQEYLRTQQGRIDTLGGRRDALQTSFAAQDTARQRADLLAAIATARRGTFKTVTSGGSGGSVNLGGTSFGSGKRGIAKTIVAVGKRMGASGKQILAAIEAGLVESNLANLNHGDRDSVGVFQQRPSQGWHGLMNVPKAAAEFFAHAKGVRSRGLSAGQLAQAVQRSAFPGRYDQRAGEAQAILASLGGVKASAGGKHMTGGVRVVDQSQVREALKAYKEFVREQARAKKFGAIDAKVKNIQSVIDARQRLVDFNAAISDVRSGLADVEDQAVEAFKAMRHAQVNAALTAGLAGLSPLERQLAQMQGEDAAEQAKLEDSQQQETLDKATAKRAKAQAAYDKAAKSGSARLMASAQATLKTAQRDVDQAQSEIDHTARQRREDSLAAEIAAKRDEIQAKADLENQAIDDGTDAEVKAFQDGLDSKLGALVSSLEQRKIKYVDYVNAVSAILAGIGESTGSQISYAGSPEQEAAIMASGGGAAKSGGSRPASGWGHWSGITSNAWGHHASGGMTASDFYIAGEYGPELVASPRGSMVHTAAQTERIIKALGASGVGGPTINQTIVNPSRDFDDRPMLHKLASALAA